MSQSPNSLFVVTHVQEPIYIRVNKTRNNCLTTYIVNLDFQEDEVWARNRELTIFYFILNIGDRCSELDLQSHQTHLTCT